MRLPLIAASESPRTASTLDWPNHLSMVLVFVFSQFLANRTSNRRYISGLEDFHHLARVHNCRSSQFPNSLANFLLAVRTFQSLLNNRRGKMHSFELSMVRRLADEISTLRDSY